MASPRRKYVKKKEIIELVAEQSGYHKYEVQDVVESLLTVMKVLTYTEQSFQLGEFIYVDIVDSKPRRFLSPSVGWSISSGGRRARARMGRKANDNLRDITTGKKTVDEVLAIPDDQSGQNT